MGERWACGLWKDKSCRPISLNIFFSLFQPSSLDPKSFVPSLFCSSTQLSFVSFSIYLPFPSLPLSFSTVTSSGQLPSVALWRTKPGFVYMVTEWRDGWGWRSREGWARENDRQTRNQAHTHTHPVRLSWIPGHVTRIRKRKTDCSLPAVCLCAYVQVSQCLCVGRWLQTWIIFSLFKRLLICAHTCKHLL